MTCLYRMMKDYIGQKFQGNTVIDIQTPPGHPAYHCIPNRPQVVDYLKRRYLSIAANRADIKAKAKIAAENRKLRDQYFETLNLRALFMRFDKTGYQMVCRICPMSADDFLRAQYMAGVMLYYLSSQALLQISPPDDDRLGDYAWLFTEDELLAWIDEIEAAGEVTGSDAS